MKKLMLATLLGLGLAACADTRSHVSDDGKTWETVRYPEQKNQQ
ncbi:hypothetical protein [Conchiformibius kuhniae]|uniref:Lipoprotein n=1 Tax=Conchiformibius kuhniae TaxID=211502 RepID=A0ABD8B888_9NEIS|nr:hypothetical protein [Conchiformibius kuhniae]